MPTRPRMTKEVPRRSACCSCVWATSAARPRRKGCSASRSIGPGSPVASGRPPRDSVTGTSASRPTKGPSRRRAGAGMTSRSCAGRKVEPRDFARFGWILCMDDANLRALVDMKPPEFSGHLGLLLDFAPELGIREVPDPYYGGPEGFDRVLDLIEASSAGLVARLRPLVTRG